MSLHKLVFSLFIDSLFEIAIHTYQRTISVTNADARHHPCAFPSCLGLCVLQIPGTWPTVLHIFVRLGSTQGCKVGSRRWTPDQAGMRAAVQMKDLVDKPGGWPGPEWMHSDIPHPTICCLPPQGRRPDWKAPEVKDVELHWKVLPPPGTPHSPLSAPVSVDLWG